MLCIPLMNIMIMNKKNVGYFVYYSKIQKQYKNITERKIERKRNLIYFPT